MISTRKLATELAVMTTVAGLLTLLGPFGTYALGIADRLVDWSLFVFGGYVFFRPVIAAGDALVRQSGLPRWIAISTACLLASLPTTVIVIWMLAGQSLWEVRFGDLASLYPQVLIIGAVVTVVQLVLSQNRNRNAMAVAQTAGFDEADAPEPVPGIHDDIFIELLIVEPDTPQRASLFDQLPAHLGSDLICLENEDHYIRVHTSAGNTLVLMRMRDAVMQLTAEDGERVHRDWWVARRAVVEVIRRDRTVALRLTNGLEAPVARNMLPTLRAKSWI